MWFFCRRCPSSAVTTRRWLTRLRSSDSRRFWSGARCWRITLLALSRGWFLRSDERASSFPVGPQLTLARASERLIRKEMEYRGHDIIVIGASLGGVEAISTVVASLPVNLPASVFVTLHIPEQPRSRLPDILSRSGPLR